MASVWFEVLLLVGAYQNAFDLPHNVGTALAGLALACLPVVLGVLRLRHVRRSSAARTSLLLAAALLVALIVQFVLAYV